VRRIRKNVRERTHVPRLNIGFDSILFYSKSNEHLIEPPLKEDPKPERWHSFEAAGIRTGMDYKLFGHRPKQGNHWRWSKDRSLKAIKEGTLRPNPNTGKPEYFIAESTHILRDNLWDDITAYSFNYNYPTEKKEDMLQLIIEASSSPKDLIADFFCGSGTTLAVAEKLGRRWIGCDISRYAIHVTRKRLMETENCRPFEVLNLGKYERQVWQGVSFNGNQQTVLYEYLAFILKLYGAEPISGFSNIHGKKGKALVHVGSVDAPVTIDEIIAALKESALAGVKELHVLGWEWEMGLHELIEKEAKREDIKLVLKLIPNEAMETEAVRKGDVRFFDLAYLKTDIKTNGNKSAIVELTDFVIPNTELIPDEVRDKIKKWSDYVDYWAVDFNFQCDTFINQWTSYRTRQNRTLKLKSDPYIYKSQGKYRILVKVIDIFGIDTSQAFEIQVK
jgi:adenine-specific DNA-methyltransferase